MTHEPRCAKHKDREVLPRLCHVCQRIAVEQEIVTMAVDALLKAGYALDCDFGDGIVLQVPTADRATILAALFQGDDEHLLAYRSDELKPDAWIYFVYGNSGYDVILDYTINLEEVLKPVMAHAKELQ